MLSDLKDTFILQTTLAYKMYAQLSNHEPYFLVAEENGQYLGSVLCVIIKEGRGLKGLLSRRMIVHGGPMVINQDNAIANELLKSVKAIADKRSIYSQFRNIYEVSYYKEPFHNGNWKYEEHLNIIVDLTKSKDKLWNDLHVKRRNEIKRADKEGTCFGVISEKKDFYETYKILVQVYNRAKLPLPNYSYFETAFEELYPKYFKVFVAYYGNRIIGTMYTLCYKGYIYDWYAGSYKDYYNKYPNDLIPWKVFLWGKENGFHTFDFGGAGNPTVPYGVRDYKKKFGGSLINYGRYTQIHKPFLYYLAKYGFNIYQKLRK